MTELTEADDIVELEQNLTDGETLLWRGAPTRALLARRLFHWRKVVVYFVLLGAWRLIDANAGGVENAAASGVGSVVNLAIVGIAAIGILQLLAYLIARTTVYTITSQRVVMRFGVALPMTVNLPFKHIKDAGIRRSRDGSGDVCLKLMPGQRVGYCLMWPFVRPFRFLSPQPSLRCLEDVEHVAKVFVDAIKPTVTEGQAHAKTPERSAVDVDTVGDAHPDLPLATAGR
ncbi:MAG: photosynthetic complex putative assembly protein PuhB [Pseudomonadota bacterium]